MRSFRYLSVTIMMGTILLGGCEDPSALTTNPSNGLGQGGAAVISAVGTMIGKQRPEFQLPDTEGKIRSISEWDNKVLVVNFWATWCPPCRREIPMFIDLQDRYADKGLQFIGVAIDKPDMVSDFIDTMGINYPILVGESDAMSITKQYGNRFGALPYTVVIDRSGNIIFRKRGEIDRDQILDTVLPLL